MTGCLPTTRTVGDLARFLGVPIVWPRSGPPDAEVTGATVSDVSDDSRRVGSGDAYVAIPGRRWHGMDFEDAAPQAGAIVAISDRPGRWLPWMSDGVADGLPVG